MALARLTYIKRNGLGMESVPLDRVPSLINDRGAAVEQEIKKKFPCPTHRLPGEGKVATHRVYTGDQVVAANNLLRYFEVPLNGGGRSGQRHGVSVYLFLEEFSAIFDVAGVQVDPVQGEAYVLKTVDLGSGALTVVKQVVRKFPRVGVNHRE
jgi:hypothetical protein